MHHSFSSLLLRSAACAWLLLPRIAPAQNSEAARLEQLEETYLSNLRKYHTPVIVEYIAALEKLKEAAETRNAGEGSAEVDAEIRRVEKLSATTGVFPYDFRKLSGATKKPGAAPASKSLKKGAGTASIILTGSAATRAAPKLPAAERPESKAVPIGDAEWRIEKVAAGDYWVSILYSCAGSPEGALVTATIGAARIPQAFTADNATGGINEFRIVRLGVVSLEKDALGETITLQNSDPAKVAIWVRQVILARVSDADGAKK